MTEPEEKKKPAIKTRETKKVAPGIFDNLRKLPQAHPVEEILGLVEPKAEQPTPRTPPTAHTQRTARTPPNSVAPERDFHKVANSIVREAVAGGYFTGKSKQLYDFLYSRTRGAIVPIRSVCITKPNLMRGSGIGSERTLLKNLAHLRAIGLIQVQVTDGEHKGNEYTVFLPEEVNLPAEPTPRTPPTPPTDYNLRHAPQEVGYVPPVESGVGDVGQVIKDSITYGPPKTSYLIHEERTDDDEAFASLNAIIRKAHIEITGREPSEFDRERYGEIGELLATELKVAASRASQVSSVPAFLAEHLRRRLWKKDKKQLEAERAEAAAVTVERHLTPEQISACPDCHGEGHYYPEGYEKGIKFCKHEKLTKQDDSGQKP